MPDAVLPVRFRQYFSRLLMWALCGAALASAGTVSAGAAQWSVTNVQYLYGTEYAGIYFDEASGALDSRDTTASIITLEHANGWKYGDNFFFVDITNPDRDENGEGTSFYGELSPRLSLAKIAGLNLGTGLLKDILITTTLELGEGFRNYLYGLAVDFNLFNMPVLQVNYYARNEIGPGKDVGQQVTLVWLKPFAIGGVDFAFEGFFDYAFDMDHVEDNIITAPRLLVDLGKAWGSPGVLQVGVEYQIWRNKFGIDGIDEDVPQAMVKWIF